MIAYLMLLPPLTMLFFVVVIAVSETLFSSHAGNAR